MLKYLKKNDVIFGRIFKNKSIFTKNKKPLSFGIEV